MHCAASHCQSLARGRPQIYDGGSRCPASQSGQRSLPIKKIRYNTIIQYPVFFPSPRFQDLFHHCEEMFFNSIVCHKGGLYVLLYHCIMLILCVSIFFTFLYWVTLPRAAQLLTYVPPNGGKVNEKKFEGYLDNPVICYL
jgi:hypothetical protein